MSESLPDQLDGNDLARLYQERFDDRELTGKRQLWETLCRYFFNRYIDPAATVLDLGAGSCEFINASAGARKIAVDLNPDTKYYTSVAQVVLTSSDDLSAIESNSIDVVFTSNFFEHLRDKPALVRTLRECHRVLKPSGKLLVLMPNLRYVGSRYWDYFDHHLPLTHLSLVEGLRMTRFEADEVIPRFLPYTVKDSPVRIRAPTRAALPAAAPGLAAARQADVRRGAQGHGLGGCVR